MSNSMTVEPREAAAATKQYAFSVRPREPRPVLIAIHL